MTNNTLAALLVLTSFVGFGCGGKTYTASCGAGGPDCGSAGMCNLGTAWAAKSCLAGDKCVDPAKNLCEVVNSK